MEQFFDNLLPFFQILVLLAYLHVFLKTQDLEKKCEDIILEHNDIYDALETRVETLSEQLERFELAQRNNLETTKPTKINNWDSIREAFKGPARIKIND